MPSDPFELAAWRAARKGACPVWELDDFYTNHDTFDVLCSRFTCARCVATPEDMGFGDWAPSSEPGGDCGIPF